MTLTRRVTWIVAAAVTLAVTLTAAASYLAVTLQMRSQIDRELRLQATTVERLLTQNPLVQSRLLTQTDQALPGGLPTLTSRDGGPLGTVQFVPRRGRPQLLVPSDGRAPTVDAVDRAIAAGSRAQVMRTIRADGERLRLITVPIGTAGAVQIGKSLSGADAVARKLLVLLLLIGICGVGVGILVSRRVTARATAPVRELADAAAHVARTDDLTLRIPAAADDELGQLARRFNAMLDSLAASREELAGSVAAQQQLVADASHELRTPVTALRTNLEVLLATADQGDATQRAILTSLTEQVAELSQLVADVIEVARGEVAPHHIDEPIALHELVAHEIERARRHHPAATFTLVAGPAYLLGAPDRLARAVANLLDNAAKHGGPGAQVQVRVTGSGVEVRDDGPGFPARICHTCSIGSTAAALPGRSREAVSASRSPSRWPSSTVGR